MPRLVREDVDGDRRLPDSTGQPWGEAVEPGDLSVEQVP